jgi:oligopeptide/dipeptide ABC transporter ATP-binding protein
MEEENNGNGNLLLDVKNLKTYFFCDEGIVRAVDGVDLQLRRGSTLGIVGESGCGKSVTARSVLNMVPKPGRITEGEITLYRVTKLDESGNCLQMDKVRLTDLDPKGAEIRGIRGCEIALVPQEPMMSLSPVHTLGNQIMEAIILHQNVTKAEAKEKAVEMLDLVGMPQPSRSLDCYPHELSGGMRQRGMIAMALSCHPSLLIADEPTTALDVTTEAQILQLMRRLQHELGMAIMYITHSLGQKTRDRQRLASIRGMVPDPYAIPKGCSFHPRCSQVIAGVCDQQEPSLIKVGLGHEARCFLYSSEL